MRIAQIMLARGFGGAERYFVDLSRALAQRGHDVLAICQPGSDSARHLAQSPEVRVAEVRVAGNWDLLARRNIQRRLADFSPAVVETHLARAASLGGAAAAQRGVPCVARIHNYVDVKYYRHVNVLAVTTRDQRNWYERAGISGTRIEVIPNFSSLPPAASAGAGGTRLCGLGRLVSKKGFHVLLQAMARLRAAGWSLTLALGGDGPERPRLEKQCELLGLTAQVRFAGWQQDAGAFLAEAGLFVLPSLDEPFGIVVLEAMASGVPIVATRTRGPAEILDTSTAWLVEPGDAADLSAAIATALNDPAEARRRAANALERYRAHYYRDAVVPLVIDLYERLSRGSAEKSVDPKTV